MRPLQGTGNRLRLSLIQRPRPPPPLPTLPTVSRTLLLSSSTKFLKRSQGEKKKKKKRFFQYVKHWHGHNKTWPVWRQPEEGRFVSPGMLLSAHENQSPVYTDATKAANVPTSTLALQSTMSLFYAAEGASSAMRREGSSRAREPGFKYQLCHLLTVWPRPSHLPLCASVPLGGGHIRPVCGIW